MADTNALNKFFLISDFIKEDDSIIALCNILHIWSAKYTYMYKMPLNFDNLKFDSMINKNTLKRQCYNSILSYKNYKLFIPIIGNTICIFSEDMKQYIEVNKEINFMEKLDFISGKIINDKLYLFTFTPNICALDLNKIKDKTSQKLEIISLKNEFPKYKGVFWHIDFDQVNDKIYSLVNLKNIIVEFDINTHEYKLIKLPFIPVTLAKYEEDLLLLNEEKGTLYRYNISDDKAIKLYQNKLLETRNDIHFIRSLICQGFLYLWQDYGDNLIIINLTNGSVDSVYVGKPYDDTFFSPPIGFSRTNTWKVIDDKVIFHSAARNEIFCFSLGELVWRKQAINDKIGHEINYRHSLNSDGIIIESKIYPLDYYLDNIERIPKEPKKNNIAVGKKIFNAVCC